MTRLVIAGGSVAGMTAAQAARDAGWDDEIVVIDPERGEPYARPPLSKGVISGRESADSIRMIGAPEGTTIVRGVAVSAVDPTHRNVRLSDGSVVDFGALVVATGSRARRLGIVGEYPVRTLDDAMRLRNAINEGADVTVVGGGFLALELASTAHDMGARVRVVSRELPLRRTVGRFLAEAFVEAGRASGVEFITAPDVAVREHEGAAVVSACRQEFRPKVLVSAIGDVPNSDLWGSRRDTAEESAPLRADRTLRVDANIWAAGDVAAVASRGNHHRTPHWDAAIAQGRVAGHNAAASLLGRIDYLDHTPDHYCWTEAFGLSVKFAGTFPAPGDPEIVAGDWTERSALLKWAGAAPAVATVNHRMPVVRLRALTRAA